MLVIFQDELDWRSLGLFDYPCIIFRKSMIKSEYQILYNKLLRIVLAIVFVHLSIIFVLHCIICFAPRNKTK